MRNLKRALSLGLTAAMISGLMVMGSSAASYADVTSEDNQEAIEVLQTVGIMVGDENGDFNPDQNVTRNEMAVIMSNLMEYNVASYKDTSPFTDVPSWAEPYVAACYTNGITSGYSDTIYGGSDTVTTAQAALMLMKALGYFQYASDFGSDWQLATTRQGNAIDLFDGVDSGVTAPMTRNDVAQLVLNTLEAGTVTASTDGSWTIGDVTIVNKVTYNYVTSNSSYAESIHSVKSTSSTSDADRYVVELGEQLYQGDLRLREGTTDDFGRPSRTWSYENSEIGTYADTPDLTYTAKVESGDVYKDLGLGSNINKSDVTVFVDGLEDEDLALSIRKGSDDKVGQSANGVLTEVYYDEDADTVLVIQVNTYVGTVVRSVEASGNRDAYVVIAPEAPIGTGLTAPIGGNEKFETDEEFADEAYVLYTYSEAVDEIKSVELAEELTGVVTRAENSNTNEQDAKALTIDGTRYTDSYMVAGEKLGDISVDEQYTVYLDSYGYLIYVERIDEIGDYALLYNVDSGTLFDSNKACLIFADGTAKIVNTAKDYSDVDNLNYDYNGVDGVNADDQTDWNNSYGVGHKAPVIVTYRVDSDNEYTLRAVRGYQGTTNASKDEDNMLLVNDKAGITGLPVDPVTANSATTFVIRDPETRNYNKIGDWTSYTGIKNAPSIQIQDLDASGTPGHGTVDADEQADVYYYCKNGKMVTIMFIVPDAEVVVEDGVNKNIYLSSRDISNLIHDTDYSVSYFEFPAVVNGEPTTVKVASNANGLTTEAAVKALGGELYGRYTTNKDGIITSLTAGTTYVDGAESGILNDIVGIDKVSKEYTILAGKIVDGTGKITGYTYTITVDEDADIFYVDEDGDINVSSYNAIAIDEDDLVYAVVDDYMVQTLVIYEVNTKDNAKAPVIDAHPASVTVTQGADATLTVTAHSADKGTLSYQWIECNASGVEISKIAGATSNTYKPDTTTVGTRYYACNVTNTNNKAPGVETATATTALVTVTVNAPAAPEMTIRVYYRLNDDTIIFSEIRSNQTAEANGYVTVTADNMTNAPLLAYELVGTDTDYVAMVPNGTANVYFTVKLRVVDADAAVDSSNGAWGVTDSGTYTPAGSWNASGNTVTADFSSTSGFTVQKLFDDTVRFLGSLYRNGDAKVIVFNGDTYVWDNSGPLKGSNWYNAEDEALEEGVNTLAKALSDWQAAHSSATSVTLTVNGVDMTIQYTLPAQP